MNNQLVSILIACLGIWLAILTYIQFGNSTPELSASLQDGQAATVTLPGGTQAAARLPEGMIPVTGQEVTAVVRPEQATLMPAGQGEMQGTVGTSTFFGTDTHIHLTLTDGQGFILAKNSIDAAGCLKGDAPPFTHRPAVSHDQILAAHDADCLAEAQYF